MSGLRTLLGPRHAGHTMPADELGALSLPVGDDGVVIGDDAEGHPQMVGFHRSAPYDVLLIGGLWTAQVIALRAAGTGARVVVETGRAQAWTLLAQAAGAGLECITLHDVGGCRRRERRWAAPWWSYGTRACDRPVAGWCRVRGSRC